MLVIERTINPSIGRILVISIAVLLLLAGGYVLSLVYAPKFAPYFTKSSLQPEDIRHITPDANRIIIPKIGVNIEYKPGADGLENGAEWRSPTSGNPNDGGNFVIAAHRLTIVPTHTETVRKSPFFRIDNLQNGDEIVVDYNKKRYGYKVKQLTTAQPTQISIEDKTPTPQLTLYSCDIEGPSKPRIVVIAEPLGEVAVK